MSDKNWLYKVFLGDDNTNPFFVHPQELVDLDIQKISDNHYHLIHNQKSYQIELIHQDLSTKKVTILVNGNQYNIKLQDKLDVMIEELGLNRSSAVQLRDIDAPMPGLVLSVLVQVGDTVDQGDSLLVLEAMKMENLIKSPGHAIIKSIEVDEGESVDKGQTLITFDS